MGPLTSLTLPWALSFSAIPASRVDVHPRVYGQAHNRPFRTPWVGSAKVPRWDDAATSFRHHGCEGSCPGLDLPPCRRPSLPFLPLKPAIEFKREPE
jgi:hypothetical protein